MEKRFIYSERFPWDGCYNEEENRKMRTEWRRKWKELPGRVEEGERLIERTIEYAKREQIDTDIMFANGLIMTNIYFRISFLNNRGMKSFLNLAKKYDDIRFHSYNIGAYEAAVELCFRTHDR